jgi:integrase
MSSEHELDLTNGFLFRPTTPQGHNIINSQLPSSAMQSRLRVYLTQAGIDSGETLHSFRSGAAISLARLGGQLADVMSHVGWNTPQTALYYLKLAQVLRPGGPSDLLASDECAVLDASSHYADLNSLQNFLSAFPPMP